MVSERSERAKLLILVYSPLAMDARVLRQVRWLSQRYDVTSAAFGPSPVGDVEHIELADLPPYRGGTLARLRYAASFALGRYARLSASSPRDSAAAALLADREWDVIVANDASALPLASRLRARRGVLADLHEYAPRQADESIMFRLTTGRFFRWVLTKYLPRATKVTTVSQGIADEYFREFGVAPVVVANAAAYQEREPGPVASPIRIVHSAAPSPARRIEVMIEAVRDTKADVTLDLYLVDDGSRYMEGLRELSSTTDRVTIHTAVPSSELVEALSGYDVGVHLLPPINFNHRWALPNKLFDYVQARLGVIIGPSPEMARVVSEYGLGAITEDFTVGSLVRLLDGIDRELVVGWKNASDRAAHPLSGESQLDTFEQVVLEMLAAPEKVGR